jgi:hypothetical protein
MPINYGGIDQQRSLSFYTPDYIQGNAAYQPPPPLVVYIETGTALWNCDGTKMKDWDPYDVDWQVGPQIAPDHYLESVATASLATIFYKPTPAHGCGFAVDNALAIYDPGTQHVRIHSHLAVWSDLAQLIRVAYQVTIKYRYQQGIVEGPGA